MRLRTFTVDQALRTCDARGREYMSLTHDGIQRSPAENGPKPRERNMVVGQIRMHPRPVGRFHAFVLAAMVPLFLGAWLCDFAYWSSHQIEWSNFASWLTAGGLVFGAVALLCALVDIARAGARGASLTLALLLLVTWVLGFINALVHARDAWAVMPTGLILSVIVALLACVSAFVGFTHLRAGAMS